MANIDSKHIWHPYSSITKPKKNIKIKKAKGVYLYLDNKTKIIDGMSSWWSVIHGYNNPKINREITKQTKKMSHIMFGGLTHKPVQRLTKKILSIVSPKFQHIFYSDSGSVAVEVAMKMAIQYWSGKGDKNRFLTIEKGYHGDTFGAMSVCDPKTGMHTIFNDFLPKNYFAPNPKSKFNEDISLNDYAKMEKILKKHSSQIAGIILEPVVQGAGGMKIYSPKFLNKVRELADKYDVLLIFDEIATGFGRTGKLFAYEHSDIIPDILCLGKALTGGYISLASTLTTKKIAIGVEENNQILMHGPTFMANPLACRIALTSIDILLKSQWQENVLKIEKLLTKNLQKCKTLKSVKDVRVLGAIGIVELKKNVNMDIATKSFISQGVWIRPFLNLIYIMPPYIIKPKELKILTNAIYNTIKILENEE